MSEQNIPVNREDDFEDNFIENPDEEPAEAENAAPSPTQSEKPAAQEAPADENMQERLERLGGEPAPVITPEEFARLQKAGQVNIDSRGRVRTARRSSQADAGVSLRKRRAWYL